MEDTQQVATAIEKENEVLIEDLLRTSSVHELPSTLTTNPVIHKGDETLPAPMVVQSISSAGHVTLWETRTFEPAEVLYYMVQNRLLQRRPDGSYRWTRIDPKMKPRRGTYKCLLHAKAPDRAHYDALGFRSCKKSTLTNPYQVRQHMLKKHKQEWAAIEQERIDREREEDRQVQQAILLQMAGTSNATQVPKEPVVETTQEPTLVGKVRKRTNLLPGGYFCMLCKKRHHKDNKVGKKHLKYQETK